MKALLFIVMALMPALAQAKTDLFCQKDGEPLSALSDHGRECEGFLMDGNACFVGKRSALVNLINSGYFNWDEEWLEGAHYRGRDSIAYEFVDGPNELRQKISINRCDGAFFGR